MPSLRLGDRFEPCLEPSRPDRLDAATGLAALMLNRYAAFPAPGSATRPALGFLTMETSQESFLMFT